MNTHRFYKAFACVVAIIIAAQPFVAYAAKASGSDAIKAAQAQATAARSKLNGMSTAVEEASEDYYAAKEKTAATTAKIKKSTAALKQAEAQLVEARAQLNERSASTYRSGELSFLSVLMGSDSFQDFVSRFELMRRIATSDADLVVDVRNARAKIEATKQQLNEQRSAEKTAEAKELKEYKRVQGLLNAQKSYLASLDAQVKDLMAAEQKRAEERERRKAEEERKQREAEEKRRQQQNNNSKKDSNNSSNTSNGNGSGNTSNGNATADDDTPDTDKPSTPVGNLGSSHPEVVKEARKYIGKTPYQWGGTTPSGFDCSGLTQYCYKKAAGISIPRTSRSQLGAGAYIPPDRKDLLKPGDLVFFGNPIHHVGIYSGGSMMIHAPQTGQKVSESYAFRSDYVGACRP